MLSFIKSKLSSGKKTSSEGDVPAPDLSRIFPEMRKASEFEPEVSPEVTSPGDDIAGENDAAMEDTAPAEVDHQAWLERDTVALKAAYDTWSIQAGDTQLRRELFISAHNLRGTAEPFGRPAMARLAASLCQLLESDVDVTGSVALVKLHIDAINAALSIGGGEASDSLAAAVCVALEDQVGATLISAK